MASELRVTTIANNAGTESVDSTYVINGTAKASAITGYSSGTPQTTKLFNVSSLSDTGTGSDSKLIRTLLTACHVSKVRMVTAPIPPI